MCYSMGSEVSSSGQSSQSINSPQLQRYLGASQSHEELLLGYHKTAPSVLEQVRKWDQEFAALLRPPTFEKAKAQKKTDPGFGEPKTRP